MDTRFRLTETRYGSPGIYDANTGKIAAFVDDEAARDALSAIVNGDRPSRWLWREAYGTEVVF